jgi:hypothetical protein
MKIRLVGLFRFVLITVGVIALTSFSIDATDTLRGSQSALSLLAKNATRAFCPDGMSEVSSMPGHKFCIDTYEAGLDEACIIKEPKSVMDTTHNIADPSCLPISAVGVTPWTYVAQPQAVQLCAKVGKRLPTPAEWFEASLGTPDSLSACNLAGEFGATGLFSGCRSGSGVFDMVGNVWEFVSGGVEDGSVNGWTLPESGYVAAADAAGLATVTELSPNPVYNSDYFWSQNEGEFVLMRGGFYGSKDDGGIYTVHARTEYTFTSAAVGFRCVKDLE